MNYYNQKTKVTASIIGFLLGMAGFLNHGIFEILQGNNPTNGLYIEAIGKEHRFWLYGTEGAFTLIPNFLITGIFVLLVSICIVIWSIRYIHLKHGANIFLGLLILLTLVGGGIGHIVLYLPAWGYITRINKPLSWWQKKMSKKVRVVLGKIWTPMIILTSVSWLIVMELGIFGFFPGLTDPEIVLNICFGFVILTVFFANLSFICGIARDIEDR